MANIIVLGSGLVGSVIAKDLSIKHSVSVVDISKKNLNLLTKNIKTYCLDVSQKDVLENLVKDYDLVVGALPGFMGYNSMRRVINIRPARYVQNSKLVVKEALSDAEMIDFENIGTLESWNSDGLRTLIKTMNHVPNMIEKTLRYPGCVEYIKVLRSSGFFSYDEIEVNGNKVRSIDLTSKLLFRKWKMKDLC